MSDESRTKDAVAELCRRMEALSRDHEHRAAACAYDERKQDRDRREKDAAQMRQAIAYKASMDERRERQRELWRRNWQQGLRPVRDEPGAPITREQYDLLFASHQNAPPFEHVQGYGDAAVRSGMDAFQGRKRPSTQQLKHFWSIVRQVQHGFGVHWVPKHEVAAMGLRPLEWDDSRGALLSQSGANAGSFLAE